MCLPTYQCLFLLGLMGPVYAIRHHRLNGGNSQAPLVDSPGEWVQSSPHETRMFFSKEELGPSPISSVRKALDADSQREEGIHSPLVP